MKDQTDSSKDWLTDPDFKGWLADTNDSSVLLISFAIKHLN